MTVEAYIREVEAVLGDRLTPDEVAFVSDSLALEIVPQLAARPPVHAVIAEVAAQAHQQHGGGVWWECAHATCWRAARMVEPAPRLEMSR